MSTRRGFWARYDAWWERNGHWAWFVTAALSVWGGGMQDDGWRWLSLAYGTIAAFNSGWCWQKRMMRRRLHQALVEAAREMGLETFQIGEWRGRRG